MRVSPVLPCLLLLALTARAWAAPDLAAVVDAPTAEERRQAADALAARDDLALDDLLGAMLAFGDFAAVEPGVHVHDIPLSMGRVGNTFVYVPAAYDPTTPAPLVLALHGAGGRGAEMIRHWRTVADELGLLLAAPTEAGEQGGFAFTFAESEDALAVLRWIRRHYNVDENRVHLTGISRGGHLAWDLALRQPDPWASLAPMIGAPRLLTAEGQNNLRYVENVAHLPIRDLQGRGDDPRLIFNLALAFERLKALGAADVDLLLQSGYDHGFDFTAVDWKAFFASAVRDPRRERVVRLSAREGEGRAAWVEILETKRPVAETFTLKVSPDKWSAMGDQERRRFIQREADERTARLEAARTAPGQIEVKAAGVKAFRLLLSRDMLDPAGRVEIRYGGRRYRRDVEFSKAVLLREYAERFDRTFLPVVEIRIP